MYQLCIFHLTNLKVQILKIYYYEFHLKQYISKNLPNIITLSRIIVIPLIIIPLYIQNDNAYCNKIAAAFFLYACISDFLDGYFARFYNVQSNFGRVLDPIADKLLVGAVIIVLVDLGRAAIIPSITIICREILVSGLREFLAELNVSIPVSRLAKIKTAIQMLAIFMLLIGNEGSGYLYIGIMGNLILWVAAGLTVVTCHAYVRSGITFLK